MKKLRNKGVAAIAGVWVGVAVIGFGHYMHVKYNWGANNPNHTSSVADPLVRSAQNSTPDWVK